MPERFPTASTPTTGRARPRRSADWVTEAATAAFGSAVGLEHLGPRYLRRLLLAIPPQLQAVRDAGVVGADVVEAVYALQRQHSFFIDPLDDWFARNTHRLGQGFDMASFARDPGQLASKFDRLANRWEEYVVGCKYQEVFAWLVRAADALAPSLKKGGHFLDVACGVGLMGHTLRLVHVEGRLTGADISAGALAKAAARDCYDELLTANVNERLPVADRSIDVALCTGATELLDVDALLQECSRVVKPAGQLWVSFQHDDGISPNPTAHQHVFGMTEASVRSALERCDFQILTLEQCPNAFYTPSPDGVLRAVPYLFVRAQRCGE
jgi:ubiquinone/menaquinone biosynthesis C-methylase UbiE